MEPQVKQIWLTNMVQTVLVNKGFLTVGERVSISMPGYMMGIRGVVERIERGPREHPDKEIALLRTVNK
jgi:hypothetical protein